MRGYGLKLCQERLGLDTRKNFFSKSIEALERAAQGGGGVTIYEGVQEPCRYCTEEHGWWASWGRADVELDGFSGLFQPK